MYIQIHISWQFIKIYIMDEDNKVRAFTKYNVSHMSVLEDKNYYDNLHYSFFSRELRNWFSHKIF